MTTDASHPIIDATAKEVAAKGRAPQIRPRLQDACRLIVTEGLSVPDAAKRAGMAVHSMQVALRKPHVRAFLASVKAAWMDSRTSKAWLNIANLADQACSEDVRLKANRVFLEAAGELGGSGVDQSAMAKTLVQIVINQANPATQLPGGQLSGVIEALPYQPTMPDPSNSHAVGRDDFEGDDDE